jgi:hypothetical protein
MKFLKNRHKERNMRLEKWMCILKAHKNVVEDICKFIYLQMLKRCKYVPYDSSRSND